MQGDVKHNLAYYSTRQTTVSLGGKRSSESGGHALDLEFLLRWGISPDVQRFGILLWIIRTNRWEGGIKLGQLAILYLLRESRQGCELLHGCPRRRARAAGASGRPPRKPHPYRLASAIASSSSVRSPLWSGGLSSDRVHCASPSD